MQYWTLPLNAQSCSTPLLCPPTADPIVMIRSPDMKDVVKATRPQVHHPKE